MNVADANGLLMVVAKVCFVAEKDNKMFHYSLCVKVVLRYLPFYLG